MQRRKSSPIALLCLSLGLAGCAGDPDRSPGAQAVADTINTVFYHAKWRQIPATPKNQAETVVIEQSLTFVGDTALLDSRGQEALNRFLREAAPAPGQPIALSVPGAAGSGGTFDRLTLQRLEALRQTLADRGYETVLAAGESERATGLVEGEIGLTVTKVMAVLPDCDQPQPLEPSPPDFVGGFGCTTAYNLGTMVAYPEDLERGAPLAPADPEVSSRAVQRYRIGDIEPLEEEDTKSK